jgi:hypothetical protein
LRRGKRADVENDHIDEQVEEKDNERKEEYSTVPIMRASWWRVDVTGVLDLRSTYVVQSPHWHLRWRRNNRHNTLNGGGLSSASSEREKSLETISHAEL